MLLLKHLPVLFGVLSRVQVAFAGPVAMPATPGNPYNTSRELKVVSFEDEFTQYLQPGETLLDCDPKKPECNAKRGLEARQGQPNCPEGSHFRYSYCGDSDHAVVKCYSPYLGRMQQRWVRCPQGSVCVQQGTGIDQRGRCQAIVDLVEWYTRDAWAPAAQEVHGTMNEITAVVNNYYTPAGEHIAVYKTDFTAQPGNIDMGQYSNVAVASTNSFVPWGNTPILDVSVTSQLANTRVLTFARSGQPLG